MGRAEHILSENRDTIEHMMQQMDDFADAHGGYMNKAALGNARTKPATDEGAVKKAAGVLGAAALGAGAMHVAQNTGIGKDIVGAVKPHLATAKKAVGGYIAKKTGAGAGGGTAM